MNLANKYRPTDFDDVVAQEVPVTILKNHIETNNLQPTYLLVGGAGCGKTSLARIAAKKVSSNIVEIDGASNNGVENIRNLIEDAKMVPIGGGKKVYIVDEVHMLTPSAFNALLKILEEPPQHVLFMLATTELYKVPQTIQSRCMYLKFNPIPPQDIYKRLLFVLKQEEINEYEDEAIRQLAKMGQGGLRKAISLLDRLISYGQGLTMQSLQLVGLQPYDRYYRCIKGVLNKDFKEAWSIAEGQSIYKLKEVVWGLLRVCVDARIYQMSHDFDIITLPKTKESVEFLKSASPNDCMEFAEKALVPLVREMDKYKDEDMEPILKVMFMQYIAKG